MGKLKTLLVPISIAVAIVAARFVHESYSAGKFHLKGHAAFLQVKLGETREHTLESLRSRGITCDPPPSAKYCQFWDMFNDYSLFFDQDGIVWKKQIRNPRYGFDWFTELARARPLVSFFAKGSFVVDPKLQAMRDQFKDKSNWTEEEALQALHSASPKYGPQHKRELLAILPLDAIWRVTGCKLRPETARFVPKMLSDLPPNPNVPPILEWEIEGDVAATKTHGEANCTASFEPFEGRMTHLTGFSLRDAPTRSPAAPLQQHRNRSIVGK